MGDQERAAVGRFSSRFCGCIRTTFSASIAMRQDIAGRQVYLALAMDEENVVRMKPQNLLLNLPTAARS